ncbi:hypothetical protein BsWGS_17164 [Bradybaena similaris]
MTSAVPTKIVLKSMTRMSLNDRFSSITPTVQSIRAHMAAEHQVSAANQRLAQQLAHRPGLLVPPGNMYLQQQRGGGGGRRGNFNPAMTKPNLQQRLGQSNIKNRLMMPLMQPMRGRGRGRGRGGNFPPPADMGNNQWMNANTRGRGNFYLRGPPRGRGGFRGRRRGAFNRYYENVPNEDNRRRRRRRRRRYAERYGDQNTFTTQSTSIRGNTRGIRPGFQRGRGRGRGNKSNVSVTDLDKELDAYMAKSKTHLDSELDAYMSEVSK